MSTELTPVVIMEAHPDLKRPYILPFFGMIQENKLKEFLLEKLVEYVNNKIDITIINSIEDIEYFWDNIYSDCYMDNSPWEATAIVNGVWENVNPSNIDLFNALIKEKKICYISSDEDEIESIIINDETNEESCELLMDFIE